MRHTITRFGEVWGREREASVGDEPFGRNFESDAGRRKGVHLALGIEKTKHRVVLTFLN